MKYTVTLKEKVPTIPTKETVTIFTSKERVHTVLMKENLSTVNRKMFFKKSGVMYGLQERTVRWLLHGDGKREPLKLSLVTVSCQGSERNVI